MIDEAVDLEDASAEVDTVFQDSLFKEFHVIYRGGNARFYNRRGAPPSPVQNPTVRGPLDIERMFR